MSGPRGPTFDSQTLAAETGFRMAPTRHRGPARGLCVDPLTFTYHLKNGSDPVDYRILDGRIVQDDFDRTGEPDDERC